MESLPREYVLLKKINTYIDKLLNESAASEIARLNDIYDYIKDKEDFAKHFPTPVDFSRFMRKMHDQGILKQLIRNCTVDTTIYHHYQWRFFTKARVIKKETTCEDRNVADSHPGAGTFFKSAKKYEAANGVLVRSTQELYILNQLLAVDFFDVYYETPLAVGKQKKFPDFTVRNKITGTIFRWEHFGINDESDYGEAMADKLSWYRDIGFRSIEEGGRLVVTIYQDDDQLVAAVTRLIEKMKGN